MTRKRKSEFYRVRWHLFLDIPTAAQWFEVTERTIRNWDRKALRALRCGYYRSASAGYQVGTRLGRDSGSDEMGNCMVRTG